MAQGEIFGAAGVCAGHAPGVRYLRETAALEQLRWGLDALAGEEVTANEVAGHLGKRFQASFPPQRWIAIVAVQAPAIRPFTVTSLSVEDDRARARLDTPSGPIVITCVVDDEGLIDNLGITTASAAGLTPRLPLAFDAAGVRRDPSAVPTLRFIVVAGVPGTGKSTLADRLGRELGIPVFALDWLLGALTPFGGRGFDRLGEIGEELLTTLAYRQLALGQSAIIDTPGENVEMRARWESLAAHFGAAFSAIVCTCSDEAAHQQRLTARTRGIPGWHDGGNWAIVKPRRDNFRPWVGDHVIEVDAVNDPDKILDDVLNRTGRR